MWQLIKDEIRYYKLELYISFFSLPIIFIAIHFIPDMTQQPIQNEGLFIFIFIIILAFNPVIHENRRREKRNRLYRLLNISSTQTALVRVMLSMVCWGSMMILYLILPALYLEGRISYVLLIKTIRQMELRSFMILMGLSIMLRRKMFLKLLLSAERLSINLG